MTAKLRLAFVTVAVVALIAFSARAFLKEKNGRALAQVIGALLLLVVVLTHVAETFHLFTSMGWGLPNSP